MVFLVYLGSSRCYSRAPGGGRGLRGWAGHPALSGALCPLWSRRYSTGLHTSGGSHERFLKSVFLPVGKHTHLNTQSAAGPVFIVCGQLPANTTCLRRHACCEKFCAPRFASLISDFRLLSQHLINETRYTESFLVILPFVVARKYFPCNFGFP